VVKDLQGLARCGLELERVAGLGVEHRYHNSIVGLVPEQSNVDAVVLATVKLSEHPSGGRVDAKSRDKSDVVDSGRRGSSVTVEVLMVGPSVDPI
jgi:hypothetical protein